MVVLFMNGFAKNRPIFLQQGPAWWRKNRIFDFPSYSMKD